MQQAHLEHAKAARRETLGTLTAPVTGTVQQLAIHTVGGVVTEAQTLMVIVPDNTPGEPLVAEVMLENKDIGFVHAGQSAELKLETFPFTRYGTVSAGVHLVTADAVFDDKRGAVFPARLLLHADTLQIDGRPIRLTPGMNLHRRDQDRPAPGDRLSAQPCIAGTAGKPAGKVTTYGADLTLVNIGWGSRPYKIVFFCAWRPLMPAATKTTPTRAKAAPPA